MLAVPDHELAVHQHVRNAHRVLVRPFERRTVRDRVRVERDEVRERARRDPPAPLEPQPRRGHARHLVDRGLQRHELLLAAVVAQHARVRAVVARVHRALHLLGGPRLRAAVGADHAQRMREEPGGVLLAHAEADHPATAVLDHDAQQQPVRVLAALPRQLVHPPAAGPRERVAHGRHLHRVPPAQLVLHLLPHRRLDALPQRGILEPRDERGVPAVARPHGEQVRETRAVRDVRVTVEHHVRARRARGLDQVQHRLALPPVPLALRLEVRDLHGHAGLPADRDRFLDRGEQLVILVAHVARVRESGAAQCTRQRDQLVAIRERAGRVLEPAGQPARALAQRLRGEGLRFGGERDAVDSGDHRCLNGGGTALGWPGRFCPGGTLSRRERTTW